MGQRGINQVKTKSLKVDSSDFFKIDFASEQTGGKNKITVNEESGNITASVSDIKLTRSKISFETDGLQNKEIKKAKLKITIPAEDLEGIGESEMYLQFFNGSCKTGTKKQKSFSCGSSRVAVSTKGALEQNKSSNSTIENIISSLNPKEDVELELNLDKVQISEMISKYNQIDLILKISNDIDKLKPRNGENYINLQKNNVKLEVEYYKESKKEIDLTKDNFVQNHTYTDQEFDSESGLMYYNSRYYDPELKRFTSVDP